MSKLDKEGKFAREEEILTNTYRNIVELKKDKIVAPSKKRKEGKQKRIMWRDRDIKNCLVDYIPCRSESDESWGMEKLRSSTRSNTMNTGSSGLSPTQTHRPSAIWEENKILEDEEEEDKCSHSSFSEDDKESKSLLKRSSLASLEAEIAIENKVPFHFN